MEVRTATAREAMKTFYDIREARAEIERLHQELSIAEERLANYAQEVEQLKAENARLKGRCAALAFLHYGGPSPGVDPPFAEHPGKRTS